MITGFNTDIEHKGVVYHVQTEDKGLASPLILSLVYVGGAILASKRTPYEDLISSGFDEEVLAQRLQRQHRLICAAVNAGRLDELKQMGARIENITEEAAPPVSEKRKGKRAEAVESGAEAPVDKPRDKAPAHEAVAPLIKQPSRAKDLAYTVYDSRRKSPLGEAAKPEKGIVLTILDEQKFGAGESVTFRVLVQNRSGNNEKPLEGVPLSVKILGTNFKPQIYSVKTERDGVAIVSAKLPRFTSGRAAILIRAVADGHATEMRRVIHPAK